MELVNKDSCIVCAERQERRKKGMPHRHVKNFEKAFIDETKK